MFRQGPSIAIVAGTVLLLQACSLIIDTNPDGVIYTGGAAGRSGENTGGSQSNGGNLGSAGSAAGGAAITSGGLNAGGPAVAGATSVVSGNGGTAGSVAQPSATGGMLSATGGLPQSGLAGSGGLSASGGTSTVSGGGTSTAGKTSTGGVGAGGLTSTGGVAMAGNATGGTTIGGAATGGTATGGASTGGVASVGGCLGSGGPTMVKLPQGYCIDSTEVTRAQYAAWHSLTTAATINAQDVSTCSWNSTFVPSTDCLTSPNVCQGSTCSNHPQVCIDWCDAFAYCKGVGKRLCGGIAGKTNSFAAFADASISQWFNACSSAGANAYPYAGAYQPKTCNGADYWAPSPMASLEVGSLSGCQPPVPYAGVYDLSGNEREWEDSCEATGISARCHVRGGDFGAPDSTLMTCAFETTMGRGEMGPFVGFRCCSE